MKNPPQEEVSTALSVVEVSSDHEIDTQMEVLRDFHLILQARGVCVTCASFLQAIST